MNVSSRLPSQVCGPNRIVFLTTPLERTYDFQFHGSQSPVYLLTFSQPALRHE